MDYMNIWEINNHEKFSVFRILEHKYTHDCCNFSIQLSVQIFLEKLTKVLNLNFF
jgi:hypothetical protein